MSEAPNASLLTMIILNGEGVEASGAGGFGGRGTAVSRAAAARFGRGLGAAFFSGASAAGRAPETLHNDSPLGALPWSGASDDLARTGTPSGPVAAIANAPPAPRPLLPRRSPGGGTR